MEINSFKGGDILWDSKRGIGYLLLNYKHDYPFNICIPYAEVEPIVKSHIDTYGYVTRLLAGDFKRLEKVTYKEAVKRAKTMKVLYGR